VHTKPRTTATYAVVGSGAGEVVGVYGYGGGQHDGALVER